MGIHDREYMRRRLDEDDQPRRNYNDPEDSNTARWLTRFFERHPRFGYWLLGVLAITLLVVLVAARVAQR